MYNLNNSNKNYVKPFPPMSCISEFPFLDYTFDKVTDWEIMQKLGEKLNEVISFINNTLEDKLTEYINNQFNNIMLNTMYDADTETLILFLENKEV